MFYVVLFLMLTPQSDYQGRAHIEFGCVLFRPGIHVTLMKWGER